MMQGRRAAHRGGAPFFVIFIEKEIVRKKALGPVYYILNKTDHACE